MTTRVPKRADQLAVRDRIPDEYLAFRFNQGPAEVVFVAYEDTQPLKWTFVAYRYPNGQHDSMTIRPEAELLVYPADAGLSYSLADDGETTQNLSGRVPPHFGAVVNEGGHTAVEVAGGLIEIDPPDGFVPATTGGLTPIHFGFLGIGTACFLPAEGSDRRSQVSVWAGVTCEECLKQAPASAD